MRRVRLLVLHRRKKLDELFAGSTPVRDNVGAYGHAFTNRLKAMGISGSADLSSIAPHLRKILTAYAFYYNQSRTLLSLHKDAPLGRAIQRYGTIAATPVMSGLHHRYLRI